MKTIGTMNGWKWFFWIKVLCIWIQFVWFRRQNCLIIYGQNLDILAIVFHFWIRFVTNKNRQKATATKAVDQRPTNPKDFLGSLFLSDSAYLFQVGTYFWHSILGTCFFWSYFRKNRKSIKNPHQSTLTQRTSWLLYFSVIWHIHSGRNLFLENTFWNLF